MILVVASSVKELEGITQFEPMERQGLFKIEHGIPAVAVPVGVGKVQAAVETAKAIRMWHPQAVVGIGTCGALRRDLKIGDILIASHVVQYDIDLRRFGLKRGETFSFKGDSVGFLETDDIVTPPCGNVKIMRKAVLGSADRFLTARERLDLPWLTEELHIDAVDMESYAMVCAARGECIPVAIIRVVSDTARGARPTSFSSFLAESSRSLCALLPFVHLP